MRRLIKESSTLGQRTKNTSLKVFDLDRVDPSLSYQTVLLFVCRSLHSTLDPGPRSGVYLPVGESFKWKIIKKESVPICNLLHLCLWWCSNTEMFRHFVKLFVLLWSMNNFWFCRTWTKRYLITLVCEVIRYRLVQVRQNQKKTFRVGGPQSPFSISSSFILSFILLPFFLNTKMNNFWASVCESRNVGRPLRYATLESQTHFLVDTFTEHVLHFCSQTVPCS